MRYLLSILAAAALVGAAPANAQTTEASTLAVIGDVPYGAAQIAGFPTDIAEINADPSVDRVIHLGDIKDGSSRCDDAYFAARLADFQTFADSFIYTPGDNEWTDCHRANNGGLPPDGAPGRDPARSSSRCTGARSGAGAETVAYQSDAFPENVRWTQSGVTFAVVHVVGSDDDQATWYGDRVVDGARKPETAEERALRVQEYTTRGAATLAWIDAAFDAAERDGSAAVALGLQANMGNQSAFAPIQAKIAERATRFAKPVLLMEGDSHLFLVDRPARHAGQRHPLRRAGLDEHPAPVAAPARRRQRGAAVLVRERRVPHGRGHAVPGAAGPDRHGEERRRRDGRPRRSRSRSARRRAFGPVRPRRRGRLHRPRRRPRSRAAPATRR